MLAQIPLKLYQSISTHALSSCRAVALKSNLGEQNDLFRYSSATLGITGLQSKYRF